MSWCHVAVEGQHSPAVGLGPSVWGADLLLSLVPRPCSNFCGKVPLLPDRANRAQLSAVQGHQDSFAHIFGLWQSLVAKQNLLVCDSAESGAGPLEFAPSASATSWLDDLRQVTAPLCTVP